MLLHAAKYPHCAVNGLFVAEKQKEKKKDSHNVPVLCVDCIPLFHGTLALAPMLEVALTLVRHDTAIRRLLKRTRVSLLWAIY